MKVVQLKGAKAPALEFCSAYHCAGDCGLPHNDKERAEYASLVVAEFDRQERRAKRPLVEKRAEVERKAREAL